MKLIENLNEAQRRAVESRAQVILVNAGAGSGKTAVLSLRLVRLLKEGISLEYAGTYLHTPCGG